MWMIWDCGIHDICCRAFYWDHGHMGLREGCWRRPWRRLRPVPSRIHSRSHSLLRKWVFSCRFFCMDCVTWFSIQKIWCLCKLAQEGQASVLHPPLIYWQHRNRCFLRSIFDFHLYNFQDNFSRYLFGILKMNLVYVIKFFCQNLPKFAKNRC